MKEILNVIHNTIYQFFDVCNDDEEVPMSDKDKLLLEVNKAICNNLKALEQHQSRCDSCIHSEEQDGSNCYECVKGMADNFEAQQTDADCISRQAVLDMATTIQTDDLSGNEIIEVVDIDDIKELLSVTSQPRWIPVSERLPEEYLCNDGYIEPSDYVLVWGDHGNYGVSRYWGNRRSKSESPNTYKDWVDLDWVVQKPVAWMPLPESYKAESEDKE